MSYTQIIIIGFMASMGFVVFLAWLELIKEDKRMEKSRKRFLELLNKWDEKNEKR